MLRTNIHAIMQYGDYRWDDKGVPAGPTWIRVDLNSQMLSVFRSGQEIGTAVILYGADSVPTPMEVELASIVMPPPELIPPPIGQIDIGPPPTLGTIVSPPPGMIVPPGGDTPQSNPTPEPREPVIETPPPVPEPATWLMMLLGFGLIGWRVRHGKVRGQQPLTA